MNIRSIKRRQRRESQTCLVCGEPTLPKSLHCRAHMPAGKPRSTMSFASQAAAVLQERQTSARKKNQ